MKSVSIVIPALNEKYGIKRTIQAIPKREFRRMGYGVQILVVDNGSDDGTGELAREAGAEVVYEPRVGYGWAYKAGFANAKGDIIATADADSTYPVDSIPKMVNMLEEENLDFITTDRNGSLENGAMSRLHKVGNRILNATTRALFRINLHDSQSGMWVFKKTLLNSMVLKSNTMGFSQEIKIEACAFLKCRWREIPIKYTARAGAVKLRTWRDGCGNLLHLLRKRISR